MSENKGDYAPPSDELLEVLGMRAIDIQNRLCLQVMENGKTEDYIAWKAINGFNSKCYKFTFTIEELE